MQTKHQCRQRSSQCRQSILLRTWTLRPDNVVEPVHHQNITKRGSRANRQWWGALVCIDHFQVLSKVTHTPGILTLGDFNPDRSGSNMVPMWKSPNVMVDCDFRWKSPNIMVSVSLGENHPMLWLVWVFGSLLMPWHCTNWQNSTNS